MSGVSNPPQSTLSSPTSTGADIDTFANQPVVVDSGSGLIKAGFAGADLPKLIFPTYVGRPKHVKVMATGLGESELLVGDRAKELRGIMRLSHPMRHGVIHDWEDMHSIWRQMYEELNIVQEQHPVLLTEAAQNPKSNRSKTAEIFFESFNVPALHFQMQSVLSLYSSGRTTGVVLESGDGVTTAVPVYEGFTLPNSITRMDVGGRDVTEYLQTLLRRNSGINLYTSAEMEIVKDIKEKVCYVAYNIENYDKDFSMGATPGVSSLHGDSKHHLHGVGVGGGSVVGGGSSVLGGLDGAHLSSEELEPEVQYKLPDGSVLNIGSEKYRAPELLFNPGLIGLEYNGIHQLLVTAINKSDLDIRRTLFQNITLSGGCTLFDGFGDRLLSEVRRLSPRATQIKIWAPPNRLLSCWVGGSILASLATFKKMWITKAEYEDGGKNAIHRKMF